MKKKIIWKKNILILYLAYISFYYILSRFIFLYLGIIKNFDLSFWVKEITFPFLYSTINIITIIFIKMHIDKINNLIKNDNLKDILFKSFPNKYIFFIVWIISVLLNIEGLITNRFNLLQYHELIGNNATLLIHMEIWQNSFILPIVFGAFASTIQTTLKLRKNQQNYHLTTKIINEFQKLSYTGFQIYLIFVIVYFILIILKMTSENLPLSVLYIVCYCSSVLITIHIFKQSLMSFRAKEGVNYVENGERNDLFKDIQYICDNFQNINDGKEVIWEDFKKILINNVKFSNFFENLFKENSKLENFEKYFKENKSKRKILILLYIVASTIIKKKECIANNIINELKISKSTTHRNINYLEKEGLIIRKTILDSKDKILIPNYKYSKK